MRYQKLDLNLLAALDALLADPHVTRAAERLNVTQSAMSGSLGRLREYFDDELVRQTGRRMVLTPLGKELRDPVRELLALTDRVLATKSSFDPLTSERTFTLHCTDYVWVTMISDLVARLGREAPSIKLEYAHAISEFIERRADFAIKADRFQIGEYPSAPLFSDPMVCIAWTGNEEIGETLSEDEFFALPHIAAHSPHLPGQSPSDRANPMISVAGHVALIVPWFAKGRVQPSDVSVNIFLGEGAWKNHFRQDASALIKLPAEESNEH